MLPPQAIQRYTLREGHACPALSCYIELTPDLGLVARESRIDRVSVVENLRHDVLEPVFNEATVAESEIEHHYGPELKKLWQWAMCLERARRGDAPEPEQRPEYHFHIANDRVEITRRARGTPIDKVVSELMIHVNSVWAKRLAESETPAIYRVQGGGKVRMSGVPSAHSGLAVDEYVWASSPLRRYVDLVNQRQLVALVRGDQPPYRAGDERLPAIMREFESAYEAYGEFQRTMERYWCLRWLLQENVRNVDATVLRENLCRFDELPLVARVASLAGLAPGARVALAVSDIDLLDLTFHCEFIRETARVRAENADTAPCNVAAAATR
jgi:exoribonuclease-2